MYCPFCGVEIPDSSTFCGFCGKKIPAKESAAEAVESAAVAVSEPVSEVVENVAAAVPEPVSEAVESAAAVPEPVSEAVESAASAVPEPVSEAVESAASAVPEPVSEAVESAASAVPEPVSEAVDSAAAAVPEPVSEAVESAAAAVPEPVSEAAENAAAAVPEPVSGAVESAADAASENISEGKETAVRRAFDITALLKNKVFLICVAAVLVLIILISNIVRVAAGNMNKNPFKGFYYSVNADGETVFFYNGNLIKGTDFSSSCGVSAISDDGTKALVVDGDSLTLLSDGKAVEITNDLCSSVVALSSNGKTALYMIDDMLVSYSGGKKTKIYEFDEGARSNYVISPDGGTVVFAEFDSDYSVKSVSAWRGGKLTDLDEKFRPIAVSNGGKMVYGVKSNDLVYVKNLKSGSSEKIREASGVKYTTADNSGIIFESSSSTYYFDASTKEPIKITGSGISIINAGGYFAPHKDFNNFYATSGTGVYKFSRKGSSYDKNKIISGASKVSLSDDGKTFVYRDSDELIKVPASNPGKETVIGNNVYSFRGDPTLKYVYYLDDDGDLRFANSKKTKIMSDVESYYVNYDGVCVFSDSENDLYYSVKGGEKKKVSGISDVEQITFINGIIYVVADDTLYVTKDGKKFTKTGVEF